jgi:hypothetical protein
MTKLSKIEIFERVIYYSPFVAIILYLLVCQIHNNYNQINNYVGYSVIYLLIPNNIMAFWRIHRLQIEKKKTKPMIEAIIGNIIVGIGLAIFGIVL